MNRWKCCGNKNIAGIIRTMLMMLWLLLVCFFSSVNSISLKAAERQRKIVTVGFTESTNFLERKDNDEMSGLAYDYLQKISYYTDWEYRYVYGEWDEITRKFYNGEIDVLPGLSKTPEREQKALFSDYPMGTESYYIYVHADDPLAPSRERGLRGGSIGVNENTLQQGLLERWNKDGGFEADIRYYPGNRSRMAAFDANETMATVTTDFSVKPEMNMMPIALVGGSDYYLAISKNRKDLLDDLNRAQGSITAIEPGFTKELLEKYYRGNAVSRLLSREEDTFVKRNPRIRIGYYDNYMPFTGTDRNGNAQGILTDLVQQMLTQLRLEKRVSPIYRAYRSTQEMIDALNRDEIDVAFPIENNMAQAEKDDIFLSSEMIKTSMFLVFDGAYDERVKNRIAVIRGNRFQEEYTRRNFPNAEIVFCDDIYNGFDMVKSGEADSIAINELRKDAVMNLFRYRDMQSIPLPEGRNICMAVKRGETQLLSLLERGITSLPDNYAVTSTYKYIGKKNDYSFEEFVYANIYVTFAGALLLVGLVIGGIVYIVSNRKKRRDLDRMAHIDNTTGIKNRRSFDEAVAQIGTDPVSGDFVFLSADLNELKQVNDTMGHEAGDELIISAANYLNSIMEPYGNVFRVGGDEFAAIGHIRGEERQAVFDRIREDCEKWTGSCGQKLSISVGFVAAEELSDPTLKNLRVEAERRMYEAKTRYYRETGHDRRGARSGLNK
ncbi:diguanylate cyclase domain-containing protein [[Clostridium] aminophilum]|uniref:Diguanylate cyclase (GGDEF) domain-containing protein n=1 Tax=[Clostridium] aminophilum TaxID=1526 RepID=A0A1I6IHT7_9FIRM|nr:transporter substrate-binding domain-containing protein [[Clostridium] aminophilum]SFR66268.1 diguanylate cyclase (GGDEF) domain-containing protein [[Clostridium] aminophilum]